MSDVHDNIGLATFYQKNILHTSIILCSYRFSLYQKDKMSSKKVDTINFIF